MVFKRKFHAKAEDNFKAKENFDKTVNLNDSNNFSNLLPMEGKVSQYNMFGLRFQHLSLISVRLAQLSDVVLINEEFSTSYLKMYHTEILTLLREVSPLMNKTNWDFSLCKWKEIKNLINDYFKQRCIFPHKKIPEELIMELSELHRMCLLIMQRHNLGISIQEDNDIDSQIEGLITGS